jgi:hypothetical protein
MKMSCSRLKAAVLLFCWLSMTAAVAAAPQTVSGVVRNQTTTRPSAGDDVFLLRLAQGMQEEARTKTDTRGLFALNVTFANSRHVVRVFHQGVNYDQVVSGSTPLEVQVFDAVSAVNGLSGNIGIAQMESDGKVLKVTEMYAITNASSPPVTQASSNSFVFTLPGNAALQSAEVRGPESIWLRVTPALMKNKENEYAINFPLRPGDTLFKFTYSLAYKGPAIFHLKLAYPIKKFAVMHPASMSFKASLPGTFSSPGQAQGLQVEQAVSNSLIREVPAFEISGAGAAPPSALAAKSAPSVSAPPVTPSRNVRSAASAISMSAPVRSEQELWLAVLAIIFILAMGAFAVLRMKRNGVSVAARKRAGNQRPLLEALKGELSRLERARLRGSISTEEYAGVKQALNQGIQVATSRSRVD